MDIFGLLTMLGGLALFLYGMHTMGDGLAKMAGSRLEQILEKLTSTPIRAVLLGAGVTAVIQSSSATTVMVVGFVNSGIMKLSQAVGIIMGANVGTTITSWILSLAGVEGDSFFIQLLKPSSFSPVLAMIGVIFLLFLKDENKKDIGTILLGFAVLMFGMETMSGAVKPLADVPEFTSLFVAFKNPILGMLVGALLTAVIQSSSASVGILQAMCATGAVSFGAAIPIIMGQNIGTCVTAMISGIGASKNAKRTALVHLYFNLIGTAVFMIVFYSLNAFLHFTFLDQAANGAGIALVHTAFNIMATLVLLPFSKVLERLAVLTIPEHEDPKEREQKKLPEEAGIKLLDERFLERPAFAVAQAKAAAIEMAKLVSEALTLAMELNEGYDKKKVKRISELEQRVDTYEDGLGTYLVQLCAKPLAEHDNHVLTTLLKSISDLERMADHAVNLAQNAQRMNKEQAHFSKKATAELAVFTDALQDIIQVTFHAFEHADVEEAMQVEPLEEVIDDLKEEIRSRHIKRLAKGKCTIELGFALTDIVTNYERIADHCSNIAVAVIQVDEKEHDVHKYLGQIKAEDPRFAQLYHSYKERYALEQ
ncbi:MAG: Na/Pi cotransporter family protein [bacterium]|nr:Na/Pi cotransporter family protein [bacterium]MDY4099232.1 Na/Pi cotransporter family protein [Lachnospiraceae bacterium]